VTILYYQPRAHIDELFVGQCTVHRASGSSAARWWLLWFHVKLDNAPGSEVFCVPVNPMGEFEGHGPGGRTWALKPKQAVPGVEGSRDWAVSPSVNILDSRDAVAGACSLPPLWHQTIEIHGVPDSEPWAAGEAA